MCRSDSPFPEGTTFWGGSCQRVKVSPVQRRWDSTPTPCFGGDFRHPPLPEPPPENQPAPPPPLNTGLSTRRGSLRPGPAHRWRAVGGRRRRRQPAAAPERGRAASAPPPPRGRSVVRRGGNSRGLGWVLRHHRGCHLGCRECDPRRLCGAHSPLGVWHLKGQCGCG